MTVGPWKDVSLHSYGARISEFRVDTSVSGDLAAATDVKFEVSDTVGSYKASVRVNKPDGALIIGASDITVKNGVGEAHFSGSPGTFDLWYPVGYGKQPIYTVELSIADAVSAPWTSGIDSLTVSHLQQGSIVDRKVQKIGYRRVEVVQEKLKDEEGHSFLFEVNGIRIFCGGIVFDLMRCWD